MTILEDGVEEVVVADQVSIRLAVEILSTINRITELFVNTLKVDNHGGN